MTTTQEQQPKNGLDQRLGRSSRPSNLNLFDFGCAIVQSILIAAPFAVGLEAEMRLIYETQASNAWEDLPGFPYARAFGPLVLFGVIILALLRRRRLPDPERRTLTHVDRAFLQGVIAVGGATALIALGVWGQQVGWLIAAVVVALGLWASFKLWGGARGFRARIGSVALGVFLGGPVGVVGFLVVHATVILLVDPFDFALLEWARDRILVSGLATGALVGCWLAILASIDRETFDGVFRRRFRGKKPKAVLAAKRGLRPRGDRRSRGFTTPVRGRGRHGAADRGGPRAEPGRGPEP